MNMKKRIKAFFTLKRRANDGFTLVELIVVIAILAILGGVALPAYSGYVKKAERAGDEQLLAAVNTAYAAACVAEGSDIYLVNGAYIGLTSDKKVDLTSVTPHQESFALFYAGNEDSAFKVFPGIYFNLEQHRFVEGSAAYMNALNSILEKYGAEGGAIDMVQASAYAAMGATKLMGAVEDVTAFATLMISGGSGKIYDMVNNPEYLLNLANMMGMDQEEFEAYYTDMMAKDPDAFNQILANSTVLSVANTVNSESYAETKAGLIADLSDGKLSSVISTITSEGNTSEESLAAAALIYGLYTAYDPEGAREITKTGNLSQIPTNTGEGSFVEYLTQLSKTDSRAYADMEGYFAALEIVNEAVSDPDVANKVLTNGYEDEELVGIVGSVIGG